MSTHPAGEQNALRRDFRKFYNCTMSVFTLGLNHTTAPIDMRGRFAFSHRH